MKSRKSGLISFIRRITGRTAGRTAQAGSRRSQLRQGLLESLEKRELLAVDVPQILQTGWFTNSQSQQAVISYLQTNGSSGSNSRATFPEGAYDAGVTTVVEAEPNNGFSTAQLLNFGNGSTIIVTGSVSSNIDQDYYRAQLNAGDILDLRLSGLRNGVNGPGVLSLFDASRKELISSQWRPLAQVSSMPDDSPLTGSLSSGATGGEVAFHYVIPSSGLYYLRTSDASVTQTGTLNNYTLNMRRFRPPMESQPAGTKQILYLDFEGGFVSRSLFGFGIGSARMSPMRTFMQQYGLQPSDEAAFIDQIVSRVTAKFQALGALTTNPNFAIEIRNSKDHFDPWGESNVSRVVIAGTFQQLVGDPEAPSGLLGIAQSIDPGNYDTQETALVMHDTLIASMNSVPISSAVPRMNVIAEAMAVVIAHEAGHYFGAWHQDPSNTTLSIMDAFFDPVISTGAGRDGIWGTADDVPIQFAADGFGGAQPFFDGGVNDVVNWLGWGLIGGQQGARVSGVVFQDRNLNRTLDAIDTRLSNIVVYADLNGNGVLDNSEPSARTAADGSYSLLVPSGSRTIRVVVPTGFRLVAPQTNAQVVTVGATGTITGRNFGLELVETTVTGRKWNDLNGNGLRDSDEPNIGGTWVYIDLDGDGRLDIGEPSVRTKDDGTYVLPHPGVGTFQIREVIESGWIQSFPGSASNFAHTVTLTGNPVTDAARLTGLDFGNRILVDYGDAPASYGVASHGFTDGLRLGTEWDADPAPQFSAAADADDLSGTIGPDASVIDDEDGVELIRPLVRGRNDNRLRITATNTTGREAYLSVWADFNGNGVFDSNEKFVSDQVLGSGSHIVTFSIPATAQLGNVITRLRYSHERGLGPTGASSSGEVEDHRLTIVDSFSLAIDDTASVRAGSVLNVIDVLANDFRAPGETLRVIRTSGPTAAGGTPEVAPNGTGVLYRPAAGFIGIDTFTYTMQNSLGEQGTATVTVNVNLFFENPLAVDDSFDVPVNSVDFPLNVLANDIEGQNGALTILSITQPNRGGAVSIATGGKSLRYTPARNFGGTESFTYTVIDLSGARSTAKVTLHTIPGDRLDDQVQVRLIATDMFGTPISVIEQGRDFKIAVEVDDLRFDAANPGVASGVFAAYMDLLYSMQLVSLKANNTPGSRFNFEVSFLNNYDAATTGDASIPGIVNEFGATSSRTNLQNPDPIRLAEITFTARSAGIANFMPDPADLAELSDTLLFNVPGSAVPIDRIRYLGTQLQIFADGVQFPQAVDDSLTTVIPVNAIQFPIDVLANDRPGLTGSITIVEVTQGTRGSVAFASRSGTPGQIVQYTPNFGISGFDQFTYTIQDGRGFRSTATVSVRVGPQPAANTTADFDIVVTDLSGQPIDTVALGSRFQVRAYIQDVRGAGSDRGLFTAYMDMLYNASLVSPVLSSTNDPNLGFLVSFAEPYTDVREGDIRVPGIVNEIGAQVSNLGAPVGSGRFLLYTITMTANALGTATFIADPADIAPFHDTLTYLPPEVVTPDRIRYGFDQVQIVASGSSGAGGEYHNAGRPLDVNNDGRISSIDALLIINHLNGTGVLRSGEGEATTRIFPDTNADGRISAFDALLVINYLNSNRRAMSGSGEGEGGANAILEAHVVQSMVAAPSDSSRLAAPPLGNGSNRLDAVGTRSATDPVEPISSAQPLVTPAPAGKSQPQVEHYSQFANQVDRWFASADEDDEDIEWFFDEMANSVRLNTAH
ncbi:MAG: tandem-95 repeat protein [Pirellulaceae bacterium]|nr:tandem-95 repeat protein [Pirellulaceae bacterium]